jgi:hypothetical protein
MTGHHRLPVIVGLPWSVLSAAPLDLPATDRRKPSLCQVGAASARARRSLALRGTKSTPLCIPRGVPSHTPPECGLK